MEEYHRARKEASPARFLLGVSRRVDDHKVATANLALTSPAATPSPAPHVASSTTSSPSLTDLARLQGAIRSECQRAGLAHCIRFNIGEPCRRIYCDATQTCSNVSRRNGEVTQLFHVCSTVKDNGERCRENHAALHHGRIHPEAQFISNELIPSTP